MLRSLGDTYVMVPTYSPLRVTVLRDEDKFDSAGRRVDGQSDLSGRRRAKSLRTGFGEPVERKPVSN